MLLSRLRPPYALDELVTAVCLSRSSDRERFEQAFAEKFGFPKALFFPYGRSALFSLLQAFGWNDKEILCPAYTCAVVPHAILLSGNRPIFVDSQVDHFLTSADAWQARANGQPAMAILTPLFGYPIDRAGCEAAVSRVTRPFLLYDVAQGFGVEDADDLQTSRADAALFSLGIGKILSTLYGGVLTLRDASLHRDLKAWRDRNFNPPAPSRTVSLLAYGAAAWAALRSPMLPIVDRLEHDTNLLSSVTTYYYATDRPRLPDDVAALPTSFQSRLGLGQLRQYEFLVAARRETARRYERKLQLAGLSTFSYTAEPTWSIYPFAVADRSAVVEAMHRKGIQLGILNDYCCADLPGYEISAGSCPNATRWGRQMVNLPNWPGIGKLGADRVLDALLRCRDENPAAFLHLCQATSSVTP